jgi:hypothetical protein
LMFEKESTRLIGAIRETQTVHFTQSQ